MKDYKVVEFMGCKFFMGAAKKFDKDFEVVKAILSKDPKDITKADRFRLLTIYNPSYHESGKIEGITSFDASATNCLFCKLMRKAATRTAAHICAGCYDKAQEESFKGINIINRHSLNMLIMQTIEFEEAELVVINVSKIDRINSSGDTPNKTYAINMLRIAKVNRHAYFAYWAKNKEAVIAACKEVGKPKNMKLVYSSPIINKAAELPKYFDFVFTVYVNEAETRKAIENGARECNGKKCRDCGYKCYLNGWNHGDNIAEVLRTTKEQREQIEKALGLRS